MRLSPIIAVFSTVFIQFLALSVANSSLSQKLKPIEASIPNLYLK
jgi:hypothetical protein